MFAVGKRYEFRMIEAGDEILFWGTVERHEHPLLKIANVPASESDDVMQHGPNLQPGDQRHVAKLHQRGDAGRRGVTKRLVFTKSVLAMPQHDGDESPWAARVRRTCR